ncbi:endonuclease/exonuclease/phosphatase family protein [Plantactinospora sp. BC1]|uniref:endonuclease/exonuclease/phosphatase family protein n=1 Tax=Plantactinospora sp. BC1 TaxID=2108470 RepID=UPI001F1728A0|nr:endonuclease/exonuclease/phosphatase family protein [Plantactinospora sp. BC1]
MRSTRRWLAVTSAVLGVLATFGVPGAALGAGGLGREASGVAAARPAEAGVGVAAVPARTVKIMTWNACGNNSACKYYEDPNGLIGTIRWHMRNHGTPMDAAIVQEVCSSFAKPLEYQLEEHYGYGWDVRFAPIKLKQSADPATSPDKQCVRGRGDYGIMLAVPDENTWWEARYLPSADGAEWRVAICATVESWWVKLCNAHFSYNGDDASYAFRTQQVAAYQAYVWPSRFRVIFGGDLNLQPPANVSYPGGGVLPLYDSFVECAQAGTGSPRTGPGTYYTSTPHDNANTIKIDYLFTNAGLPHTCGRPGSPVESSDHLPIWMTVDLPAT